MTLSNREKCQKYWDETAEQYQALTRISTTDFHYGPLLAGDKSLKLLPPIKPGMKCLELGCGAAQNSFYLASLGADCLGIDISAEQIDYAQRLAKDSDLEIKLQRSNFDEVSKEEFGSFDLIHSTWALPFADNQEKVVRQCAQMLNPGGYMVLTTGHPVFAGEWIELEDFEEGMFLTDYFKPPVEVRFTEDEEEFIQARQYPISTYLDWLLSSGLTLVKLVEHQPVDVAIMSEAEIEEQVPYDSSVWRTLYEQVKHIPFVVTYIVKK